MLKLYINSIPDNIKCINDVEKGFASINLKCTDKEKELVSRIENGTLIDSMSFIDRFGYKLYTTELSTGCKAALCALNYKDSVINLVECGLNARDAIISLCNVGSVLIDSNSATISNKYVDKDTLDVSIGDYRFTDIDRLNTYIFEEYPFNPDINKKGIEVISHD